MHIFCSASNTPKDVVQETEIKNRKLKYNAYLTQEEFPVYKTAGDLKSKVFSLKKYDSFQLFETYPELKINDEQGNEQYWQYIEFQGQPGYIPLNTVRHFGFELLEPQQLEKGISSFHDLPVYEFPSEDSKILNALPEFTEVDLLSSSAHNSYYYAHHYYNNGWTEIKTKEGIKGFVKGDSVLSRQDAKTNEKYLETNGVYEKGYFLIKKAKYDILQNPKGDRLKLGKDEMRGAGMYYVTKDGFPTKGDYAQILKKSIYKNKRYYFISVSKWEGEYRLGTTPLRSEGWVLADDGEVVSAEEFALRTLKKSIKKWNPVLVTLLQGDVNYLDTILERIATKRNPEFPNRKYFLLKLRRGFKNRKGFGNYDSHNLILQEDNGKYEIIIGNNRDDWNTLRGTVKVTDLDRDGNPEVFAAYFARTSAVVSAFIFKEGKLSPIPDFPLQDVFWEDLEFQKEGTIVQKEQNYNARTKKHFVKNRIKYKLENGRMVKL